MYIYMYIYIYHYITVYLHIWGVLSMGVPQNEWFVGENPGPTIIDYLVVSPFQDTPIDV